MTSCEHRTVWSSAPIVSGHAHQFHCHRIGCIRFYVFSNCQSTANRIHENIFDKSAIKIETRKFAKRFDLHDKLTMWLQPPFFSMDDAHFGQPFVCLRRYSIVLSLSFFFQFLISVHGIGSWGSSPQVKQKLWPHTHLQFCKYSNKWLTFIAWVQPGAGHQRSEWLFSTKLLVISCSYFFFVLSSVTNANTMLSSTTMPHFDAGQQIDSAFPPSKIFTVKYWRQHSLQYSWPQPRPTMSYAIK